MMLPPLHGIGGTAIGGYDALPPVEPPYLPPAKDPNGYTLVLDLDETLVHYYEHNGHQDLEKKLFNFLSSVV